MDKISDLRQMSIEDLNKELERLWGEKISLRIQRGSKQIVKPHVAQAVKKRIAQVKTLLTEKMNKGAKNE